MVGCTSCSMFVRNVSLEFHFFLVKAAAFFHAIKSSFIVFNRFYLVFYSIYELSCTYFLFKKYNFTMLWNWQMNDIYSFYTEWFNEEIKLLNYHNFTNYNSLEMYFDRFDYKNNHSVLFLKINWLLWSWLFLYSTILLLVVQTINRRR